VDRREAIVLEGVDKNFGAFAALRAVDLRLLSGHFVLLAGANGAGKSTLLRLMAGLSKPSRGRVRLAGEDPRHASQARRAVGLLAHQTLLYDDLTAGENLLFFARLYGLAEPRHTVEQALCQAGLQDRGYQRVGTFSRGLKQRLALARATLHDPSILLLDEPYTGLDRRAALALSQQLRSWRQQGRTCVLVTHRLEEAVELMDFLLVLRQGRLSYQGPWGGGALNELEAVCARYLDSQP
jgi:heme exporter protein A